MTNIIKSSNAFSDAEYIWFYIAKNSSHQTADKFIDKIEEKLQFLANNPNIGRQRPELMKDLRSFPVDNYVIFYIPVANGVEVVRILHAAQDLEKNFTEENIH